MRYFECRKLPVIAPPSLIFAKFLSTMRAELDSFDKIKKGLLMGNIVSDRHIAGVVWRSIKTFVNEGRVVVSILNCNDTGFIRFGRVCLCYRPSGYR